MILKTSFFAFVFLLGFSCKQAKEGAAKNEGEARSYMAIGPLIEAERLMQLPVDQQLKIIDFRKPEDYAEGHIEGALNIWRPDLEDHSYPYAGMRADKKSVEVLLSGLGVQNGDHLVIYDNKGLSDGARLWWVLRSYNYPKVSLLNGGLTAWRNAGGKLSQGPPVLNKSNFRFPSGLAGLMLVEKDELKDLILASGEKPLVLDTRTLDEYSGKRRKAGAVKAGRIPTSIHMDWAMAIDYEETKKFKDFAELEKIYSEAGASLDAPIIVYCHSGARSAHTSFVLTQLLGYTDVRNYDGSWAEWSYFDDLPFEKDSVTTVNQ